MTMDGSDMYCVLDQRARLDDLLQRKTQSGLTARFVSSPSRLSRTARPRGTFAGTRTSPCAGRNETRSSRSASGWRPRWGKACDEPGVPQHRCLAGGSGRGLAHRSNSDRAGAGRSGTLARLAAAMTKDPWGPVAGEWRKRWRCPGLTVSVSSWRTC
jgi:hypothetical protein